MKIGTIGILFSLTLLLFGFQNCSEVSFDSTQALDTPNEVSGGDTGSGGAGSGERDPGGDVFENDPADPGLLGGHFDLDTSTQAYEFDHGKTDKHVHKYDDEYGVNGVDFFNMLEKDLGEINEAISVGRRFVVIVANAQLSPGGVIELNGIQEGVVSYQEKVNKFSSGDLSALTTYSLGDTSVSNSSILNSFAVKFSKKSIVDGNLVATDTKCVVSNKAGANGEYRNGALVVQAIDVDDFSLDQNTRTASSGMLWEATIFWHKEGVPCN